MSPPEDLLVGMLHCITRTTYRVDRPLTSILDAVSRHSDLDILLAPEWFFVSKDKKLYYPGEYAFIRNKLEQATEGMDMLLIPGSIARLDDEGHYQNTALVISGGKTLLEYSKRTDGGDGTFAGSNSETKWKPGETTGVFRWRDYTSGLEICADHCSGVLKEEVKQSDLDIHIIVACGMSLCREDFAIHDNGIVLLCDGSEPEQDIQGVEGKDSHSFTDGGYESSPVGENIELRLYRVEMPQSCEPQDQDVDSHC